MERDDGPRDLSPDPQGFRSSDPCRSGRAEFLPQKRPNARKRAVELREIDGQKRRDPACPDRTERDDGSRDLSPDTQDSGRRARADLGEPNPFRKIIDRSERANC